MRQITCQNTHISLGYGQYKCDRFLVGLPDWILTQLKLMEGDPEGKIIVRCPKCHGATRFAEIKYINGKLTFQILTDKIYLGEKVVFDDSLICAQAGLIGGEDGEVKQGAGNGDAADSGATQDSEGSPVEIAPARAAYQP
jgi:hypothetical protein